MIADHLKNISLYSRISNSLTTGLEYLSLVNPDITIGDYWITSDIKATVMEYYTKEKFELGYEAHKKNIDIQYCIVGMERILWAPLINMNNHTPYDEKSDRAFYDNPSHGSFVDTGNGVFAVFFPEDAHGPQVFVTKSELIKKIVIKIPINLL